MDQNKLPFDPPHLGGPSGVAKKISVHVVQSVQTVQLSCLYINTVSNQTEASLLFTHAT
jgi:hypothetical protein